MVTVSNAFNHGLNVGDVINVTEVTCTSSACSFTVTNARRHAGRGREDLPSTAIAAATPRPVKASTAAPTSTTIPSSSPATRSTTPSSAVESCTDAALTICAAGTTNPYPAPVRFCTNAYDANRLNTPTGMDPTNTQGALPQEVRRSHRLHLPALRPVPAHGHHLRRHLTPAARCAPTARAGHLHRQRGDDQLRQLVRLLPHAHADDENGRAESPSAPSTAATAWASSPSTPAIR